MAMPPSRFPLELLFMVVDELRDGYNNGSGDVLCLDALKSFRQVNHTLYDYINSFFWRKALELGNTAERVLTSLIRTNDLTRLKFFLDLGMKTETPLPEFFIDWNDDLWNGDLYLCPTHNPGPTHTADALLVAACMDNVPLARLLLDSGAEITITCGLSNRFPTFRDGSTLDEGSALHAARSAEMVQLFLDFGADPEMSCHHYLTPLHCYAQRGNTAAMRVVLERGVKVDPWCWERLCTPLYRAARYGNTDAAKLLLDFGANAHGERRYSRCTTPLHLAALAGDVELVRILIDYSPKSIKAQDCYGDTPLDYAALTGNTEAAKLLVQWWPDALKAKIYIGINRYIVWLNGGGTRWCACRWAVRLEATRRRLDTGMRWFIVGLKMWIPRLCAYWWMIGL
jgi:hypothetical protein